MYQKNLQSIELDKECIKKISVFFDTIFSF